MPLQVCVVKWTPSPGLAGDIATEVRALGCDVDLVLPAEIPDVADLVLTFAPWGRMLAVSNRLAELAQRHTPPKLIHWNLENPPDLAIPWPILAYLSQLRLRFDRLHDIQHAVVQRWLAAPPLRWFDQRMTKFRYLGEYYEIHRRGWLHHLAETSLLFTDFHRRHGLPTEYVPWGTAPSWHRSLELDRDIDVIWLGKRRTRRRSQVIEAVRQELCARGYTMLVVDGVEHPLVYGDELSHLLNRAKIALHVNMHWYDNSFHMRFHMVAGNRPLMIAEQPPPHYREYVHGVHYVACAAEELVESILYYLAHTPARLAIVEQAYLLVTGEMQLRNSVARLLSLAETVSDTPVAQRKLAP